MSDRAARQLSLGTVPRKNDAVDVLRDLADRRLAVVDDLHVHVAQGPQCTPWITELGLLLYQFVRLI